MLDTVLAIKGRMSQTFIEGRRICVTKVTAGPCVVSQVKNLDKDGYWAVQLGIGHRKSKNISKALQGHLKKVNKGNLTPRFICEVRLNAKPQENVGETLNTSDIFSAGDIISVTGTSKGKGFAGGVKRWHFAGGPKTHGQSDRERAPGSIGGTTTPGRVYKGKHMATRMGNARVTVKNLQVVSIDPETHEMTISGQIPGVYGNMLVIKRVSKGKLEGIHEVEAQVVEGAENGEATNSDQAKDTKTEKETK